MRAKVADVRRYGDKVTHIPEGSGAHYSARPAIFRRSRITASYRISMRIGIGEVTDREGIFTSHTSVGCHCRKSNLAFTLHPLHLHLRLGCNKFFMANTKYSQKFSLNPTSCNKMSLVPCPHKRLPSVAKMKVFEVEARSGRLVGRSSYGESTLKSSRCR